MCTIETIVNKFDTYGILPHHLPNAIGMWENEQECMVWTALQCDPKSTWVEVGAFCGGSAILLGLTKKHPILFSIDNNFKPIFDQNVYKRAKLNNIVQKLEINSLDFLYHYDKPDIGFVFLDGYHSFSMVLREFEMLQPLLLPDAIIGFHDVSPMMYTNSNQTHIRDCYEYACNNYDMLMNSVEQDFRLDEVISYICIKYDYKIIDIPVRNNDTHFKETGLQQWVRGTTSPLNSYTAIRKK